MAAHFIEFSLEELPCVATQLWQQYQLQHTWCFIGGMGLGKTTLIAQIAQAAGVTDHVSSPTYGLVNTYHLPNGCLHHFDCYRLKTEQEAIDIGFETYFENQNWCFIEWPEKVSGLLPKELLIFELKFVSNHCRQIQIKIETNFNGTW